MESQHYRQANSQHPYHSHTLANHSTEGQGDALNNVQQCVFSAAVSDAHNAKDASSIVCYGPLCANSMQTSSITGIHPCCNQRVPLICSCYDGEHDIVNMLAVH